jgi:hypothetical protein
MPSRKQNALLRLLLRKLLVQALEQALVLELEQALELLNKTRHVTKKHQQCPFCRTCQVNSLLATKKWFKLSLRAQEVV